ncbi:MAG: hybrid sensor histidine kinase/response regulator [Cohaesibacter sp.]|jgi:CheY-like chemotaxis protein|nr:hybrid sensor histidine kinase/response regulator [Cohaesibacter sp.]
MPKKTKIAPTLPQEESLHHDLRTHISAVISLSNLIKSSPDPDQVGHLVDAIHLAADNALAIMDGGVRRPALPCGQGILLHECLDDFRTLALGLAHSSKASFSLTIDEDIAQLPPIVLDQAQLHRVLILLLDNALHYGEGADIFLTCGLDHESQQLELCLCDTGPGFGEDSAEHLFMPYQRGSNHQDKSGDGLGLWSARNIISVMGGTLTAKANLPHGACFRILLPLVPVFSDQTCEELPFAGPQDLADRLAALTILVVDDNKTNHLIMGEMLKAMNIRVLHALSGKQALHSLETNKPDLIFIDIRMPEMGGWDLAREIDLSSEIRAIPMIAISSDAAPAHMPLFAAWQQRPVRAADLLNHIQAQLF